MLAISKNITRIRWNWANLEALWEVMGTHTTLVEFVHLIVPLCRTQKHALWTVFVAIGCIGLSAMLFLAQPLLLKETLDLMFSSDATHYGLYWKCTIMFTNYVFLHVLRQYGQYFQNVLVYNIIEDVRLFAFRAIVSHGHKNIERHGVGTMQSRLTNDISSLRNLLKRQATKIVNGSLCRCDTSPLE